MVQRPYKRTKYRKSDPEVPGDSQRPDRKGNRKQSTGAQSRVGLLADTGFLLRDRRGPWRKAVVVTAPALWSVCLCVGILKGFPVSLCWPGTAAHVQWNEGVHGLHVNDSKALMKLVAERGRESTAWQKYKQPGAEQGPLSPSSYFSASGGKAVRSKWGHGVWALNMEPPTCKYCCYQTTRLEKPAIRYLAVWAWQLWIACQTKIFKIIVSVHLCL